MAKKKPGSKNKPRSGDKKHGRNKRKAANRGNPISAFVRGKISAADYWKATNIKTPGRSRV